MSTETKTKNEQEFIEDLKDILHDRGYTFHVRDDGSVFFKKDGVDWSDGDAGFDTEEDAIYDALRNYIGRIEKRIRKLHGIAKQRNDEDD